MESPEEYFSIGAGSFAADIVAKLSESEMDFIYAQMRLYGEVMVRQDRYEIFRNRIKIQYMKRLDFVNAPMPANEKETPPSKS